MFESKWLAIGEWQPFARPSAGWLDQLLVVATSADQKSHGRPRRGSPEGWRLRFHGRSVPDSLCQLFGSCQ